MKKHLNKRVENLELELRFEELLNSFLNEVRQDVSKPMNAHRDLKDGSMYLIYFYGSREDFFDRLDYFIKQR